MTRYLYLYIYMYMYDEQIIKYQSWFNDKQPILNQSTFKLKCVIISDILCMYELLFWHTFSYDFGIFIFSILFCPVFALAQLHPYLLDEYPSGMRINQYPGLHSVELMYITQR